MVVPSLSKIRNHLKTRCGNDKHDIKEYLTREVLDGSTPFFTPQIAHMMHNQPAQKTEMAKLQEKVFQLTARLSDFSMHVVGREVDYFFNSLGLHPMYFAHFTPAQVANHIGILIASKKVAKTTNTDDVRFKLEDRHNAFYLASLGPKENRTHVIKDVTKYITGAEQLGHHQEREPNQGFSVMYMASDAPAFGETKDRRNILRL